MAAARSAYRASVDRCRCHAGADRTDVHETRQGQALQRRERQLLLLVFRGRLLAADLRPDLLGPAAVTALGKRRGMPWAGLVAGPTAWAVNTQIGYALVPWVC